MEDAANVTATSITGSVIDIKQRDINARAPEARRSKTELVVSLLGSDAGAAIDDIINATSPQKHSVSSPAPCERSWVST
jgi:hypothetical protein